RGAAAATASAREATVRVEIEGEVLVARRCRGELEPRAAPANLSGRPVDLGRREVAAAEQVHHERADVITLDRPVVNARCIVARGNVEPLDAELGRPQVDPMEAAPPRGNPRLVVADAQLR